MVSYSIGDQLRWMRSLVVRPTLPTSSLVGVFRELVLDDRLDTRLWSLPAVSDQAALGKDERVITARLSVSPDCLPLTTPYTSGPSASSRLRCLRICSAAAST